MLQADLDAEVLAGNLQRISRSVVREGMDDKS